MDTKNIMSKLLMSLVLALIAISVFLVLFVNKVNAQTVYNYDFSVVPPANYGSSFELFQLQNFLGTPTADFIVNAGGYWQNINTGGVNADHFYHTLGSALSTTTIDMEFAVITPTGSLATLNASTWIFCHTYNLSGNVYCQSDNGYSFQRNTTSDVTGRTGGWSGSLDNGQVYDLHYEVIFDGTDLVGSWEVAGLNSGNVNVTSFSDTGVSYISHSYFEPNKVYWSIRSEADTGSFMTDFGIYTMSFDTDEPPPPSTNSTRIVSLVSPSNAATTASTTVDFQVNYVSNLPIPDHICIVISAQFQTLTPICQTITQSGDLDFSTSTTLVSGQAYSWYAFIADEDNVVISQSDIHWFSVVTPQQSFEPQLPNAVAQHLINLGYGVGTSTNPFSTTTPGFHAPENPQQIYCSAPDSFFSTDTLMFGLCNLFVFLVVPDNFTVSQFYNVRDSLIQRFPASVIYNTYESFVAGLQEGESQPFELTLELSGTSTPIMSQEIYYGMLGEETAVNIRGLIGAFLWILFALGLMNYASNWWALLGRGKQELSKW